MRKLLDKIDNLIHAYQRWSEGQLPDWANPKWNRRCQKWLERKGPTVTYLVAGAVGVCVYIIGTALINLFSD
jgi:hypothetical protein